MGRQARLKQERRDARAAQEALAAAQAKAERDFRESMKDMMQGNPHPCVPTASDTTFSQDTPLQRAELREVVEPIAREVQRAQEAHKAQEAREVQRRQQRAARDRAHVAQVFAHGMMLLADAMPARSPLHHSPAQESPRDGRFTPKRPR
jgi:type II secretory pathway pseudopilin PulG